MHVGNVKIAVSNFVISFIMITKRNLMKNSLRILIRSQQKHKYFLTISNEYSKGTQFFVSIWLVWNFWPLNKLKKKKNCCRIERRHSSVCNICSSNNLFASTACTQIQSASLSPLSREAGVLQKKCVHQRTTEHNILTTCTFDNSVRLSHAWAHPSAGFNEN